MVGVAGNSGPDGSVHVGSGGGGLLLRNHEDRGSGCAVDDFLSDVDTGIFVDGHVLYGVTERKAMDEAEHVLICDSFYYRPVY